MEQWWAEDQLCCCWNWWGLGSYQGWQCESNDDNDDDDDDKDVDDDNQDVGDNDGDAVENKEEDDDGRDFLFGQVMLREGTAMGGSGRWVEYFYFGYFGFCYFI